MGRDVAVGFAERRVATSGVLHAGGEAGVLAAAGGDPMPIQSKPTGTTVPGSNVPAGSARETFDERVSRVFTEIRSTPGPYRPIPRQRLARMLGCSPTRIRTMEDRFLLQLFKTFRHLDCTSTQCVDFNK